MIVEPEIDYDDIDYVDCYGFILPCEEGEEE